MSDIDWNDDRGISPEQLDALIHGADLETERFGHDLLSDPNGKFIEYADLCYIIPAIVREAVEAERGRSADKTELYVLLGKLVKDACTDGGSPELSSHDWERACLLSGHYCEPYLSAFTPTGDDDE